MAVPVRSLFIRFRGIVVGIRPGILWRLGLDELAADLLDGDGIVGWQVALSNLATSIDTALDEAEPSAERDVLEDVSRWARDEVATDKVRWRSAETMLGHLAMVLDAPSITDAIHADEQFLRVWERNIASTLSAVRAGGTVVPAHLGDLIESTAARSSALAPWSSLAAGVRQLWDVRSVNVHRHEYFPLVDEPSAATLVRALEIGKTGS